MGTHATKVAKNVSNKYGQKLFDSAKKLATDTIKTASKRVIQKTPEATGDLIGNKITDNITSVSKSSKELHSNELHLQADEDEIDTPKERKIYISRKKATNY